MIALPPQHTLFWPPRSAKTECSSLRHCWRSFRFVLNREQCRWCLCCSMAYFPKCCFVRLCFWIEFAILQFLVRTLFFCICSWKAARNLFKRLRKAVCFGIFGAWRYLPKWSSGPIWSSQPTRPNSRIHHRSLSREIQASWRAGRWRASSWLPKWFWWGLCSSHSLCWFPESRSWRSIRPKQPMQIDSTSCWTVRSQCTYLEPPQPTSFSAFSNRSNAFLRNRILPDRKAEFRYLLKCWKRTLRAIFLESFSSCPT